VKQLIALDDSARFVSESCRIYGRMASTIPGESRLMARCVLMLARMPVKHKISPK